ncbi:NAD(P)-binding Rossmann-like domain protein [Rhodococcus sp. MTM3W5.2]|uniref:hypothetical protein n=1 Tax=Rhodococcus sp. MTM3W5.2 TaxID=1805827 RepID=UPI0009794E34|nr:hypothetical protein [Rhodococcus sp. MTM3W5.2]AQA24893.1 NAD(P)-binding Rossmann-like domain protein [Rhodococcus sp. MTM3W5.2]
MVGSGFGGAVAALRLGQAGVRTTVLERGRRWPVDPDGTTFCTINEPDGRSAWFADHPPINQLTRLQSIARYPGLIDRVYGNGIDAIYGVGVGGGSLAFGAFTPQPRRKDFATVFPAQIDYDELDRTYYPRAKKMLGTSPSRRTSSRTPPTGVPAPGWTTSRISAASPSCTTSASTGTSSARNSPAAHPRRTRSARARTAATPAPRTASTATTCPRPRPPGT